VADAAVVLLPVAQTRWIAPPRSTLTRVADTLITETGAVAELAERVRAAGRFAIDTEFLWEKTYAPVLCLVQVAVGDEIVLIDPLAGASLVPIAALLADPAVEVLMHAPSADLLAFALHHEVRPTGIIDTQLIAGFVGLTASASLERLLADGLKVTVNHHESFSDWKRRPLSASQLEYAGDDVRWLAELVDELRRRLDVQGRTAWAEDELARRYPDGDDPTPDPLEAYRRVQRRGRLSARQMAVLREVAAWREREARRRDLPTGWVMKDPTLVEVARVAPATADALARVRGVAGIRPPDAATLIAAIEVGKLAEPIAPGSPAPPAVARRADAASGLGGTLVKVRCTEAGIAPELVATRAELDEFLESVIMGTGGTGPLATGWRRELVGDELIALVEGRVALSLAERPPYLVIGAVGRGLAPSDVSRL
jgi:ribonuclease D